MKTLSSTLLLVLLGAAACGDNAPATAPKAPTQEEMGVLLEDAASCPAGPLRSLAELGAKLAPGGGDAMPLTLLIWMVRLGPAEESHIQPLGSPDRLTPTRIVDALAAGTSQRNSERLSILRRGAVTAINMRVKPRQIRGDVHFLWKDLMEGYVEFEARVVDGAWQVVEFSLPRDRLKTTRQPDGRWLSTTLE